MLKRFVFVILAVAIATSACTGTTTPSGPQPQQIPVPTPPVGTPTPPEQVKATLAEWGLSEGEEVNVLELGTDDVKLSGIGQGCNPENAYLFWQHISVNHLREVPESAVIGLLTSLSDGSLVADKLVGDETRAVAKITYLGAKWLLIIGKAVKPTLYISTDAVYIASLLRGQGKSLKSVAELAACLKLAYDKWVKNGRPKDPDTPERQVTPIRLPTPDPAKYPVLPQEELTKIQVNGEILNFLGEVHLSEEETIGLLALGCVVIVGVMLIPGGQYVLVLAIL